MIAQGVYYVAKKEILDNFRNKWVILLSIAFALLTLVTSYFGSIFSEGWQDLGTTIGIMMSVVQLLIPIIALVLGYAAIIGEVERGSMSALLSQPLTRLEIVLGKFTGLGTILATTILVGFGVAGIVIAFNVSEVNVGQYVLFILSTIFLALVFLSISIFFSTIFKKRTTAIGGAIFLWFLFNMILPLVYVGVLIADIGLEKFASGSYPVWYYVLDLTNPLSIYSWFNMIALDISIQGEIMPTIPDFFTAELMIVLLLVWIGVFVILAFWRFQRKDI
jgi:Cu-processing system permease protein